MSDTPDLFPTEDEVHELPPTYHHHPQWTALLAAVRAAQDDDLPRLVAADWLDEQGDPDRAEFIRTQVELARLKHQHFAGRRGCRACELVRRCHRLVKRSLRGRLVIGRRCQLEGLEVVEEGASHRGVARVLVERGFVTGMTCHFSVWEADGERVLLEAVHPHLLLGGLPPPYHSGRGAIHGERIRTRWPEIGSFLILSLDPER